MRTGWMMAIAATAISLAGCAPMLMRGEPKSTAECQTGTAAPCPIEIVRNDASGKYSCGGLGTFDVKPDLLVLKGGQPVDIRWTLPDGFGFCGKDGIEWPLGSGGRAQVWDSFRSSREGPGPRTPEARKACLPVITIGWGNVVKGTFPYAVLFHTTLGTSPLCSIDPWIRND